MEIMGRVSGVFSAIVMLAIPIGQMFFGVLLDNFLSFISLIVGA